jgi:signal peptidase I
MDPSSTVRNESEQAGVSMDTSAPGAGASAMSGPDASPHVITPAGAEPLASSSIVSAVVADRLAADEALREAALRAANRRRAPRVRLGWFFEWMRVFPAAIALFLVLRAVLVEAYKIPSGSMESTLLVGDFLLVNKLVYGATLPLTNVKLPAVREPRRGDVVVFVWPSDPTKNFVKRLVALPGDTVSMQQGVLLLNGLEQDERYVVHTDPGVDPTAEDFVWQRGHLVRTATAAPSARGYRPSRNNWGPLVVPDDHYFVLGDNRDNSLDSRYWGFVPDSLMRGTPMVVYYSYSPDSTSAAPWLTNIRWRRLGERIR